MTTTQFNRIMQEIILIKYGIGYEWDIKKGQRVTRPHQILSGTTVKVNEYRLQVYDKNGRLIAKSDIVYGDRVNTLYYKEWALIITSLKSIEDEDVN